jgi:hypothetical protein
MTQLAACHFCSFGLGGARLHAVNVAKFAAAKGAECFCIADG